MVSVPLAVALSANGLRVASRNRYDTVQRARGGDRPVGRS